jgi:hypothetical protein
MKNKYLVIVFVLFTIIVTGCKEAVQYRDVLYFTGTESSPATTLTVDTVPTSLGVSVSCSEKVTKDIKINIQIDSNLVASYNKTSGKSYKFPPKGSCMLVSDSVVIKKGSNVSESSKFIIISQDQFAEGINYCVPITITGEEGDISILEPSRTIYVIINKTIITQAVNLAGSNYFSVPSFQSDATLSALSAVTMECRVYVNSFQINSPYISSVMGIEENFLLRFGDVSVNNNQLQLAGGLINGNKYPVTSATSFSTGQWYQIAAVYNGSTISLYVNGVLDSYVTASSGTINFTDTYLGGFHIGYSSDGRLLNGYISEARVWNRAVTANELLDNLCYVDPTSKGLLAYWRFNGADANGNVTDLTGHGYTAVAADNNIQWVTGVRCPN